MTWCPESSSKSSKLSEHFSIVKPMVTWGSPIFLELPHMLPSGKLT